MIPRSAIVFLLILLLRAAALPALGLWRHPEIAGKNALFADVGLAPLVFNGFAFPVFPLDLRIDYLLPLPLPCSLGLFFKTPFPNIKSFGTRIACHLDLDDPKTDLFLVYVFDCGFVRNDLLLKYNDTPVTPHYYDFRVGVRRFLSPFIGFAVESDFKAGGVIFLISAKIH